MCFFLRFGVYVGCFLLFFAASAQPKKHIVQFYGIVFHEDSLSGAVGAHIYNPTTSRGTSTDFYGYFSLPVAVGDTMRVSYQGYKKQHIVIPKVQEDSHTQLIYLEVDTVQLRSVEVTPYMSEQQFKEAVLALSSREALYPFLYRNKPQQQPTSAISYIYLVQQQQLQRAMHYNPNYIPITDIVLKPLINAIRNKRKKQKKR